MKRLIVYLLLSALLLLFPNFAFSGMDASDMSRVRRKVREIKKNAEKTKEEQLEIEEMIKFITFDQQSSLKKRLDEGADIDALYSSETLLMHAAGAGQGGMVKFLIDEGADPDIKDKGGRTAFDYAINGEIRSFGHKSGPHMKNKRVYDEENKYFRIMQLLRDEGADLSYGRHGDNVNIALIKNKNVIKLLLEEGLADINGQDKEGWTALMRAAYLKKSSEAKETVSLLLEYEADVTLINNMGWNAMTCAEERNHDDIIKMLKDLGLERSEGVEEGVEQEIDVSGAEDSFILEAASKGDHRLVKALINNYHDVDFVDTSGSGHSRSGYTPLMAAVSAGSLETVKVLLENGANPNLQDGSGYTASDYALGIIRSQPTYAYEITELLLKHRADLELNREVNLGQLQNGRLVQLLIKNNIGDVNSVYGKYTPLSWETQYGTIETMEFLLENGADVDMRAGDGSRTPLMIAVEIGSLEKVKFLLKYKPDRDLANLGRTALYIALKNGFVIIADILKEGRENSIVDAKTIKQYEEDTKTITQSLLSVIMNNIRSKKYSNYRLEQFIEDGYDINAAIESTGETILMCAAERGSDSIVGFLLKNGANIDAKDNSGRTALMIAADFGKFLSLNKLLQEGADVNLRDNSGKTALMIAEEKGHKESIEILQAAFLGSASAKEAGKDCGKDFTAAAKRNEPAAFKKLIDEGCDINFKNSSGETLLINAINGDDTKMVTLLLKNGANANTLSKKGYTALISAATNKNNDIVELLIKNGAYVDAVANYTTALMAAVSAGSLETVKVLLENGADVNVMIPKEKTALWVAESMQRRTNIALERSPRDKKLLKKQVSIKEIIDMLESGGAKPTIKIISNNCQDLLDAEKNGKYEQIQKLLDKGCDVNSKDSLGYTVLMNAARKNNLKIMQLLIDNGANVNTINKDSMTALIVSALSGSKEAVQLLLDKGADINAKNKYGETALMMAEEKGHEKIVKLLKEAGAKK